MANYDKERINNIRKNKQVIIDYYSKTNNINELEDFLHTINNWDLNSSELEEIKQKANERLNILKNQNNIKEIFDKAKELNSNISNFVIVETDKNINNKDYNGFRNDVSYLKYINNGENKLYEINYEYIENIRNILLNENNKNLSSNEIYNLLEPYLKELKQVDIDYNNSLDNDKIKEETDNILDDKIREHYTNNIDAVLRERKIINEYINKNGLENEKLVYSLNSRGERIYYLGEKLIKFNDNNEMFILDNNSDTFVKDNGNKVEENTFDKYSNNNEDVKKIPENLYEYDESYYINLLNSIFDKINMSISLNEYENELLIMFLKMCIIFKEEEIPLNLFEIYEKFKNSIKDYKELYTDEIIEIFNKKNMLDENRKDLEKELNEKKLQLVKQNNDGFIDIILICCSIIIVAIAILYIILVKQ